MASGPASNGATISLSITVAGEFRPASPARTRTEKIVLLVALLLAILLHATAIVGVLVEWPQFNRPEPPREIPVELVMEPPPPEPAVREPQPPPPQRLQSGDESGTAPARQQPTTAEAPIPAPTEKPALDSLPTMPSEFGDIPPPTPKPAAPKPLVAPTPPAIAKAPPSNNLTDGDGGGDPYLNAIKAKIMTFWYYPAVAGPLQLSGDANYEIVMARSGQVQAVRLLRSTGIGTLDDIGFTMIRRASPFAPVPDYFPDDPVRLVLSLHIGPK